jgi:tetratricopeptide (TPR) repeat protein
MHRATLILALLSTSLSLAQAPDSLCRRAEWLLFHRHLSPNNLHDAYRLVAAARNAAPTHEKVLYLWARIHFQYGENAASNAERLRWYERAKSICETLKTINDNNALGHIWWANAYGRIGQIRGISRSLFMVPTLKREYQRAIELDPGNPVAYNALGLIYSMAPRVAGGNPAKAEEYLLKALTVDPHYTAARLDLAKLYFRTGRREEARTQIKLLLSDEAPTIPADYYLNDQPAALELLQQLDSR